MLKMGVVRVSIAASSDEPGEDLLEASKIFVKTLKECLGSIIIYLGGYWGLMKYIAEYACSIDIPCVFILPENPREDPPRKPCFYPVYTGLSMRQRSETLVLSGDLLASLGGGVGTIVEIFMAYANSIPSYVLLGYGLDSDRIEGFTPYADYRRLAIIKIFKRDPVGMAKEICRDISLNPIEESHRTRGKFQRVERLG
ncbi:MAG: DNA transporter [Desulfurococcales archaeon]|jgi:uncharacterized protein (TIGR00725 family)|nr:DNA transporter [Desulfurococcales archaeon]